MFRYIRQIYLVIMRNIMFHTEHRLLKIKPLMDTNL
nr:MAG TPA: hypothetical protein [Caudoviricetes sp.]